MFNNFREGFVIRSFNLGFTIFTYNEPFYFNNLASSITFTGVLPTFLIDCTRNTTIQPLPRCPMASLTFFGIYLNKMQCNLASSTHSIVFGPII